MVDDEKRLRMAVIAGAAHATKYIKKNPRADEEEVIQHVTENASDILDNIDNPF